MTLDVLAVRKTTMPKFNNPTYQYKIGRPHDLWFVGYPVAMTVVKYEGEWQTVVAPQDDFIKLCDEVFYGGYDHKITPQMAAELTAAGYGEYITED